MCVSLLKELMLLILEPMMVPFSHKLYVPIYTHMTVHVKYFASLRETVGRSCDEVAIPGQTSVEKIWQQATNNMARPEQLLVAVNQEYANFSKQVQDGDEVAFFPPVTGG